VERRRWNPTAMAQALALARGAEGGEAGKELEQAALVGAEGAVEGGGEDGGRG